MATHAARGLALDSSMTYAGTVAGTASPAPVACKPAANLTVTERLKRFEAGPPLDQKPRNSEVGPDPEDELVVASAETSWA